MLLDGSNIEMIVDKSIGDLQYSNGKLYFNSFSGNWLPIYSYEISTKKIDRLTEEKYEAEMIQIYKDDLYFVNVSTAKIEKMNVVTHEIETLNLDYDGLYPGKIVIQNSYLYYMTT